MTKQPTALQLADALDGSFPEAFAGSAAAELRRLHAVNQMLLEALEFCAGTSYITDAHEVAEEAIAKAKE
jgi:hypothetical protein